ncbi:CaiB/BaiF CoA transferase family protein [Sphingomonas profundi]|uniref:CaiB/BaiF CoA transferase family protein n=1 Tax=Alterirhizorhabdus profundi TaxID=2681549 RepID=UPI0012E75E5C|nr:CoA transferase [Sphingomonas profundi]
MSGEHEGGPSLAAPLAGIRVIDLTTVMMGPYATHQLCALGASVIKVEPLGGDSMRAVGPMRNPAMGPMYLNANRGKKSIALDVKSPDGLAVLHELLAGADVFVSNVRSGALRRLKLDSATLRGSYPGLIHAVANGFGSGGRYHDRPAYDDLIQGLAGIPWAAAGAADDGVPRYAAATVADRVTGLVLANAILAALFARGKDGVGRSIEVPMFETMTSFVMGDHLGGLTFEPPNGPPGYARLLTPGRRPYRTSDGFVCAVVYTDAHWRAFLAMIGRAELFDADARFATLGDRTAHIDELYALVAQEMPRRTTADWLRLLNAADIPAAPMHTPQTLLSDPHLGDVGFFEHVEHPTEGALTQMRYPVRMADTDLPAGEPAPRIGAHSRSILRDLSYDDAAIDRLFARGVVTGPAAG